MRTYNVKAILKAALRVACLLPFAAVATFGQQQINLTAAPSGVTLPDGTVVPMWGYSCGTPVVGSTATCTALNPSSTGWSPIVITVPTGQGLRIFLTNGLPAPVPTSLVIVGQLGGGLGNTATLQDSPAHPVQGATWPVADPGTTNTPPVQGQRVQSFSTEVAAGVTTQLPDWSNLRPGTYLIESGTHPSIQGPMGLYGMLVVTCAPTDSSCTAPGTAYPGVSYNADVNLLLSEIDPVQNNAVNTAVGTPGFSETMVWSGQPGGCGNPGSSTFNQCYPPAVNYTPLYYLFNGVAFNRTNPSASLFPKPPVSGVSGPVLVRFVNAGLRMHVPSIVGAQTGSAVSGFGLIAEDGNPLPGATRVQSEVFLAAGKTYDVMINAPASGAPVLPVFDRQLSLSGNRIARDAGMLAYIGVNNPSGVGLPVAASVSAAGEAYYCVAGVTLTVSDPGKGVLANDTGANGATLGAVSLLGGPTSLVFNADGTFTYKPPAAPPATACGGSFTYMVNGTNTATASITQCDATSHIDACNYGGAPTAVADAYSSKVGPSATAAARIQIAPPGVLANDTDPQGHPLTAVFESASGVCNAATVNLSADGSLAATASGAGTCTVLYHALNSQKTASNSTTATLTFPVPSNLSVSVVDGKSGVALDGQDYRWIIEEDRTFFIDPTKTGNNGGSTIVPTFGTNFHTSYMPVVAQGCTGPISCEQGQTILDPATGLHVPAACDIGNGACEPGAQKQALLPSQVVLDPAKRYYISVLPGDGIGVDSSGNDLASSHAMGGAQIAAGQTSVTVIVEPTPLPPAKVSVFVFEDDFPMNGEHDAGGGVDVLAPNEPGLGGFNITLFDDVGGTGDAAGQMTYDMFNMPLSNALAGTIDPSTGLDACPISKNPLTGFDGVASPTGITGVIPVCPKFESNGTTLSPLAGQAVIANLPPGRYGVVATPGADAIARGEEWLQTNTLDGGPAHDSFVKVSEPAYFQEYGPAGYHVTIGFANPKIINDRKTADFCTAAGGCSHTVTGKVTGVHMSRTPDERLYSTGTRDTFGYTQCYASLGSPDGADFAFAKCADDGTFTLSGIPGGDWRVTIFDQWNDQIVDGISTPVRVNLATVDMGDVAVHQWKSNLYTRTFFDQNGDGVSQDTEPGLSLVPTNIRFRDGSFSNFNSTDLEGFAGFNEVFPLFNWYVVETDSNRYKNTGTHVVYDAGGPVDGSPACGTAGYPACGTSAIAANLARTQEDVPVPPNLRVPGARYCANADCPAFDTSGGSTGRVDPPWVTAEAWQGFIGQSSFMEFGKVPFAAGENGGIRGHVIYASTRPFDDPALLLQLSWEPMVPHVTMNLYQEGTAPDGSQSLKLVDTTQTSSFDDWAQGFRSDGMPNMNCPGQSTADLFYFTLFNQPNYLNPSNSLPNNSQFKCFDGLHNFNQVQPAPYDGMYQFPSIIGRNPIAGTPEGSGSTNGVPGSRPGSNCTICVAGPDGNPMLPSAGMTLPDGVTKASGKYVVEMVLPEGYELVKEEDKNILMGDSYIAPVTQQFAGLGNIFIMPDQASVASSYNPNNPLNSTTDLGVQPRHEGDTGSVETFWPCVGAARIVPDYMSLFPGSGQNAPFAGATRNLCDRKEVMLADQMSVLAKFYVFTSAHVAGHFTGIITDDFTAEFDPFSPQFGEKFSPANLPVSIKDWAGNEVGRVYADQWGNYDGLNFSSYGVNPPDPSGYVPQMMVMCMNDAGKGQTPDALFQPEYSQFCYELPFMPGQTGYFDTPVIPTSAFAGGGYNNPDCAYPDATPAIKSVVSSDIAGPWVSQPGNTHTLTIKALGNQDVNNYGYSGPSATTDPFNKKKVTRHYGFGNCTPSGATTGPCTATITNPNGNPVSLGNIQWSDDQITGFVPNGVCPPSGVCPANYGGQLVITGANGRQSVDTVTVNVGGPTPTLVTSTIQDAIDSAHAGDLIIVPEGVYHELVIMWKPVRLQGVGAASTVIDANTHPSGVLDPWRAKMVCLFGLALNGQPQRNPSGSDPGNPYDPTGAITCGGWTDFNGGPNNPQVDRMPLEGIVGWDATLNGNLAEQLSEPTLLGAYEGAGITVVGRGVRYPAGADFIFGTGPDTGTLATEGQFPLGTILLTNSDADCNTQSTGYSSNFLCKPSRIDALSVTNSSQGGGGILVHGWAHNLEISNNRVHNNTGSLSGGVSIGIGETPDALLAGNSGDTVGFDQQPWTCRPGFVVGGVQVASVAGVPDGTELPFCYDKNVNVHHNAITKNSSIGDELFSATPAGAGAVTFCPGSDGYKLTSNWICGNLSTGDGGGVAHLGYSENGSIVRNSILFNQSTNPTIPTNGGGLIVMSTAPDGLQTVAGAIVECGSVTDVDCAPGLGDGTGPGLVINANLIMGNAAESGSGGGIRFQGVNGTEVSRFPSNPGRWYNALVTNNIISDNVAGWDGGGVSLQDSLNVNIVNNSIVSNDTTASSGVLSNTFRSGLASAPPPGSCTTGGGTASCPQPAGLSAAGNSAGMIASFSGVGPISCPPGHAQGTLTNGSCRQVSYPLLYNNVIWQNRAFHVSVGALSPTYQQNIVTLVPTLNQPQTPSTASNGGGVTITGGTGACVTPPSGTYWDLGVRGDTGAGNHSSGFTLHPTFSVLTSTAGYGGSNNTQGNPDVASQYCNGARVPPEFGGMGYQVPPGTNEGNVPVPIFTLTAGATVDEGNNWINISWGPLAMANPVNGFVLGNYAITTGSSAINTGTSAPVAGVTPPNTDYYGLPRTSPYDIGAVEFRVTPLTLSSIAPTSGLRGTAVPVTLTGANLTGVTNVTVSGGGVAVSGVTVVNSTTVTATFTIATNAALSARNVTATSPGGNSTLTNAFTVLGPTLTSIAPNSGFRGTSVPVTLTGTNLTGATNVTVSGGGVSVSNIVAVNATTVTATITITAGAGIGNRNVAVVTPIGTTNAVIFTVTMQALNSVAPNSGTRGTSVPVTLTGTGLSTATAVNVAGGNVNATFTVVNDTTINATITISPGASLGNHNVNVATAGGNTNNVPFTVLGATVAFAGPTPAMNGGGLTQKNGTITVSNTATTNAGPLKLTAAPTFTRVSGTGAGTFSITGGTCVNGTVVNPGSNCTITVQYVPTNASNATYNVTITDTGDSQASRNSPNFTVN